MPSADVLAVALEVAEVLEELGVTYMVAGSLASSMHGIPRSTQDVDFVADVGEKHAQPIADRLGGRYYVDAGMISRAVRNRGSFNVIHLESMLKVDVYVPGDDPAARAELARRMTLELPQMPERSIAIASPEDTVLQKLVWFRKGDEISERQWQDVLGIAKVKHGQLDHEYLRKWAAELGVLDLLEKVLKG
jgi:hypothetical protein